MFYTFPDHRLILVAFIINALMDNFMKLPSLPAS